ncbi:MAG: lipopolysaccharide biosynthesis protein [Flavobacteriales bacterium]
MYKKLIKDIIIYGLGTALPRAINLIFTYFFTKILPREAYANVNDVFIFDFLMIQVLTFGFETAIFRFASKEENKHTVTKTALYTVGFGVLLFLVLGLVFHRELAAFRNYPSEYALFAIIIVASDTFLALGYTYLRLQEKSIQFSLLKVFNVIVNTSVLLLFFAVDFPSFEYVKNLTDDGGLILTATLVASLMSLFLMSWEFINILKKGVFHLKLSKKMIQFGAPIAIASIAYALNETFDKFFMKSALGEEVTGAYAACYKLGVFIMLYEMAFRLGIEPFFFKQMGTKNQNQIYAKAITIYTILGCMVYMSVMANLNWLKKLIIAQNEYFTAISIVPIILLANLILGIYRNISIWYKVVDKTYYGMYFSLVGVAVTIIGNVVILTQTQNFIIAAWATLIAYSIMLILSYLFSRKVNPIPYDLIKILGYLFFTSSIVFLLFYYNLGLILNNIILIIYLIVIFLVEFKTIKSFSKRQK